MQVNSKIFLYNPIKGECLCLIFFFNRGIAGPTEEIIRGICISTLKTCSLTFFIKSCEMFSDDLLCSTVIFIIYNTKIRETFWKGRCFNRVNIGGTYYGRNCIGIKNCLKFLKLFHIRFIQYSSHFPPPLSTVTFFRVNR